MDTYSFLRELADSWVMLALLLIFLGVAVWAFRPGSRPIHDDAAATVFRHDMPAPAAPAPRTAGCPNACADCACAPLAFLEEYRDV